LQTEIPSSEAVTIHVTHLGWIQNLAKFRNKNLFCISQNFYFISRNFVTVFCEIKVKIIAKFCKIKPKFSRHEKVTCYPKEKKNLAFIVKLFHTSSYLTKIFHFFCFLTVLGKFNRILGFSVDIRKLEALFF
jgi:hypothetical protein